ncbi:MAG: Na/Pi symporter [Helicobacteraceae bacterium]|nr:Na/Pi symporter [Helicobacteraceae bacterium]
MEIDGVNWQLALAGLGMFLFGMSLIESAIKTAAGAHFKTLLKKAVVTTPKSLATGVISAAVLQSSTLVSLMTLAFVGAGMMSLIGGVGVIFGANFGSVATSWIVAMLGFKFSVSSIATPMIGVSGLALLLTGNKKKLRAFFTLTMGFGLLFYGLDLLKDSMDSLANAVDISQYHGYGAFAYVAIGFVLTIVLNSSAASMAIFLAAIGAGVIDFNIAAALTIGANVGTTGTILLLAAAGSSDTKRLAAAHVIFNVGTAALIFLLLTPIGYLIMDIFGLKNDLVLALTIFHTIFNATGLIIFGFLTRRIASFLSKRFAKNEAKITRHIGSISPQMAEVGAEALKNEAGHLLEEALNFSLNMLNLPPRDIFLRKRKITAVVYSRPHIIEYDVDSNYEKLKKIEAAMLEYSTKIGERSPEDETLLNRSLAAAREATYAAKLFKDIKRNLDEFAASDDDFMLDHYNQARIRVARLVKYLHLSMRSDGENEKRLSAKLFDILTEIQNEDRNTLNTMTKAIKSGDIEQSVSPTFISINRAVVNASKSLIECAQLLYLSIKIEEVGDEKIENAEDDEEE